MYNARRVIARTVARCIDDFAARADPLLLPHGFPTTTRPLTRLRFRGHADTLKALCQCLQDHPRQAMTVAELSEFTRRPFADVHQRLVETPELFTTLPKTATTNTRYRLTLRIEHKSAEDIAHFIENASRSETRIAAASFPRSSACSFCSAS